MARYLHQRGALAPRHHYIVTFRKPQTLLNEFLKKTTGNVKNCRLYCVYRTKAREIAGGCHHSAEREKNHEGSLQKEKSVSENMEENQHRDFGNLCGSRAYGMLSGDEAQ